MLMNYSSFQRSAVIDDAVDSGEHPVRRDDESSLRRSHMAALWTREAWLPGKWARSRVSGRSIMKRP